MVAALILGWRLEVKAQKWAVQQIGRAQTWGIRKLASILASVWKGLVAGMVTSWRLDTRAAAISSGEGRQVSQGGMRIEKDRRQRPSCQHCDLFESRLKEAQREAKRTWEASHPRLPTNRGQPIHARPDEESIVERKLKQVNSALRVELEAVSIAHRNTSGEIVFLVESNKALHAQLMKLKMEVAAANASLSMIGFPPC